MKVGVGIFFFSHHGGNEDAWAVGETIKRAIEKGAPYTFFLTSYSLNALIRERHDVFEMIIKDSADKSRGWDPRKVEIGISTSHHMPVVQPGLPLEYWSAYFEGFVKEQIGESKRILEEVYHRTPRSFFPPECMFAPAFVYLLHEFGIDCTIISGEFLKDHRWAKGQVYHQTPEFNIGDTKIVTRVNDINLDDPNKKDAYATKESIKNFAFANGIEEIVLGRDVDLSAGIRGLSTHDGIARDCCLYDAISSDPDMYMVNVASIADGYHIPRNIYHLYAEHGIPDAHHYISSWMDGEGGLKKLDYRVNSLVTYFIKQHTHLLNIGKGCEEMQRAKEQFFRSSGMEFRHTDWNGPLMGCFEENYPPAKRRLDRVERG